MATIGTEFLSVQIGVFTHKRQHPGMAFWLYSAVVRGPSRPVGTGPLCILSFRSLHGNAQLLMNGLFTPAARALSRANYYTTLHYIYTHQRDWVRFLYSLMTTVAGADR